MVIGALLEPYAFTGAPSDATALAGATAWACVVDAAAGFADVGCAVLLCAQAMVAMPGPNKSSANNARTAPRHPAQYERRVAPRDMSGL